MSSPTGKAEFVMRCWLWTIIQLEYKKEYLTVLAGFC